MIKATLKYKWFCLLSIVAALSLMLTASPVLAGNGGGRGGVGSSLTQFEIDWLIQMREEEKLARDVYLTMYAKWGATIFSNIASSEQRHTDAVENLIDKYGITDPVTNEKALGHFTESSGFNKLYDALISRGLSSLNEAYRVGVDIEVLDISDLEEALKQTSRTDIDNVYGNILDGSYNHLAAFSSKLR